MMKLSSGALSAIVLSACWVPLAQAVTLDMKVLVISTGTAQEDQGLDLIDDMLDEVGVKYEVLDARRQTLTPEFLASGTHGKFNGVILTDSMLYYTGPGNYLNSAFTLEEWQTLHQYERDFRVRESVIAGYPASGPYFKIVYDLDYGMNMDTVTPGNQFQGLWQAPAGGTELFEYVNTANPLPVTDYAVSVEPLAGGVDPVVQPLLKDGQSNRTLVSKLTYADGREVLYSGITNAWYLVHSQVLNYEFLNFATRGLFLGRRQVHLAAHVDDLFLADDVWDPVNNVTTGELTYRNTARDINTLVASQAALVQRHATLPKFKLDLAFNGWGAQVTPAQTVVLAASQDSWVESEKKGRKDKNGNKDKANFGNDKKSEQALLLQFDVSSPRSLGGGRAVLNLVGGPSRSQSKVCRLMAEWDEKDVTWEKAMGKEKWQPKGKGKGKSKGPDGPVYDEDSCLPYVQNGGTGTADITAIVNDWASGAAPNYGLILIDGEANWVYTREARLASARPQLTLQYPQTTSDPLTAAVIANKSAFRFLNHTFTHAYMDASAGTDYAIAFEEIARNIETWDTLGLPAFVNGSKVLVTGNHSGLEDIMQTESDRSDDIPYPAGRNLEFIRAAKDLGIRYVAGDSSRLNQDRASFVPGTNNQIVLLPRYPTSLFYNVTTPLELEDEYNYIFFERFVNAGEDPCQIAGAICAPRSYEEILAAEADTTLRHMLTYRDWPHYFHISNLRDYGGGRTLQFDWLSAVMERYEQLMRLPVVNESYYRTGEQTRRRLEARGAEVSAIYDPDLQSVTLRADRPISIEATGLAGGSVYGGQSQRVLSLGVSPVTLAVDLGSSF